MSEEPSEPEPETAKETPSSEPEAAPEPKPEPTPEPATDLWDSLKGITKIVGQWAWLVGLISGIVYLIWGLIDLFTWGLTALKYGYGYSLIWYIISGIACIIISLVIVLPRFSMKCKNEDWDYLLNDVLVLGTFRFPLMLLWGALLAIFGYGWGGAAVLVPAFILLFAGPKPYEWTTR